MEVDTGDSMAATAVDFTEAVITEEEGVVGATAADITVALIMMGGRSMTIPTITTEPRMGSRSVSADTATIIIATGIGKRGAMEFRGSKMERLASS
jgi:hypothetical protein